MVGLHPAPQGEELRRLHRSFGGAARAAIPPRSGPAPPFRGSNYISFSSPRVDQILKDARVLSTTRSGTPSTANSAGSWRPSSPTRSSGQAPPLARRPAHPWSPREPWFWQYEDWWVDPAGR